MPTRCYMRVEAVNLSHFVYDTHDISTIRGGSFILLDAIQRISEKFQGRLVPISTAASQGLFFFECEENLETYPESLRTEVLMFLKDQTDGHATFLAAVEKDIEGNFPLVLEKLEAQIHRQQWRMPTIMIPEFRSTEQECFLDGWRPGTRGYRVDPNIREAKISIATDFRREHGTRIKHQLFYKLLDNSKYKDYLCARNLGELALDDAKGVLNGKIALIHIDGNSFGSIRRELCTTPETRKQFDEVIQQKFRTPFLEAVLHQADKDRNFQTKDINGNDALRLEILLWGGDEMTIVTPAWKGWEVLELFFEQAKNLEFKGIPLSHRATVIFCHHNAPILQIRRLAENLLDRTKKDLLEKLEDAFKYDKSLMELTDTERKNLLERISDHKYGDAIHYLVLESFDMLQGSLDSFLSSYYRGTSYSSLMIYAHEIKEIRENLKIIRFNVARNKVLEAIGAIHDDQPGQVRDIIQQICNLLPADKLLDVQAALKALIEEDAARWYVIGDLWDYIPE